VRAPRPAEVVEIAYAVDDVVRTRRARRSDLRMRVADDVNVAMLRAQHLYDTSGPRNYREPLSFTVAPGRGLEQAYLGMQLDVDPYLPRGVWRITDEHEALLFDCREEGS
jgi:hypothetical protein